MADNTTANATVGAQNGGAENATAEVNGSGQSTETKTAERVYTQKEFDSELERRTQQGLNTAREKWASELSEKVALARSEGERLAAMTEKQRAEETQKLEREEFEAERRKYEAERLEFEATKQLSAQNLPIAFAKMCVGGNAEETKENIETFAKAWSDALQAAVNDRMKGSAPKAGGGESVGTAAGFVDIINEMHR